MSLQRYVSHELTHFIGRSLTNDEERYELLVHVLHTGKLLPGGEDVLAKLTIDPDKRLSDNEMFTSSMVCFCDIPPWDMEIHMEKYGRFGISFLKSYLIRKGAKPVFYLVKDSRPLFPINAAGYDVPGVPKCQQPTRATLFDAMSAECHNYFKDRLMSGEVGPLSGDELRVHELQTFLDPEVFSLMKFFDSTTADDDPDNYYMEREWRTIGTLYFELSNVQRVILPESLSARLREALPKYSGQVQWSDRRSTSFR